ncbi:DUF1820 family protein [bacterium endosymbiont of Pedicinus badii]|uniref:DUF1820 family protein n=1 Tax=bacterium endosymbiont of Pedicinus badii TaxID=1719126 RepID=UPI0009BBB1EE|nr:DUF1820 family protein [bacterium endosymbiont of Pedicinus badii]OQM34261.1 hypothetical protein AOQ89_01855 [bacterium endosymbiont of Pedicinus badii]
MSDFQIVYRIQFISNGKNYQLLVRELGQSPMLGFIEIGDFIFSKNSKIVVDPSEEKIKNEFKGVSKSYIPLQAIIRIDVVNKEKNSCSPKLGNNAKLFSFFSKTKT